MTEHRSPIATQHTLWRLTIRMAVYYGVIIALLAAAAVWAPGFFKTLPFGGVSDIAEQRVVNRELEDALLNADDEDIEEVSSSVPIEMDRFTDARTLFYSMAMSLAISEKVAVPLSAATTRYGSSPS